MLRSLFSGVSGLRAHQTMLDVVGNNIANVNTTGYKSSSVEFEDTLSQALKAAGAPQGAQGGTNPAQVGLGVQVAAINTAFTQGPAETTGVSTDLMIQGDGFFVVNDGGQQVYTRDGAFSFDTNGNLTTATGGIVQGWTAVNGAVNTSGATSGIKLPLGASMPPTATDKAVLAGNLPADGSGASPTNDLKVYDQKGQLVDVTLTYTYDPVGKAWSLNYSDPSVSPAATGKVTDLAFKADGTLSTTSPVTATLNGQAVSIDISGITSFGGANTAEVVSSTGNAMGSLASYSISPDGTIEGVFTNGMKQPLGQIALATFNNPGGLNKVGNSEYSESVNSGQAQVGAAGTGSRGQLAAGELEGSNVDLSQEFSNLIIAERGFEANSKVITTSDEVLQDLVNLKH
ncbi:MAG: flagellar hook protein FlgE [Acidothermaceae bacterium]